MGKRSEYELHAFLLLSTIDRNGGRKKVPDDVFAVSAGMKFTTQGSIRINQMNLRISLSKCKFEG